MKTDREIFSYIKTIVKKYHNLQYVDPNELDKELVEYAKPLDVGYILSHEARDDFEQELLEYHNTKYRPLSNALIDCMYMHPDIIGAFTTGSHANSDTARLNDTVIQLVGHISGLIGVLESHPDFEL